MFSRALVSLVDVRELTDKTLQLDFSLISSRVQAAQSGAGPSGGSGTQPMDCDTGQTSSTFGSVGGVSTELDLGHDLNPGTFDAQNKDSLSADFASCSIDGVSDGNSESHNGMATLDIFKNVGVMKLIRMLAKTFQIDAQEVDGGLKFSRKVKTKKRKLKEQQVQNFEIKEEPNENDSYELNENHVHKKFNDYPSNKNMNDSFTFPDHKEEYPSKFVDSPEEYKINYENNKRGSSPMDVNAKIEFSERSQLHNHYRYRSYNEGYYNFDKKMSQISTDPPLPHNTFTNKTPVSNSPYFMNHSSGAHQIHPMYTENQKPPTFGTDSNSVHLTHDRYNRYSHQPDFVPDLTNNIPMLSGYQDYRNVPEQQHSMSPNYHDDQFMSYRELNSSPSSNNSQSDFSCSPGPSTSTDVISEISKDMVHNPLNLANLSEVELKVLQNFFTYIDKRLGVHKSQEVVWNSEDFLPKIFLEKLQIELMQPQK